MPVQHCKLQNYAHVIATRKFQSLCYTVEPLNNGHIGGRYFVPCREVVHYRKSTIVLLVISPIITFQWLNESMTVRGFQINSCLHDTLALSMVNIFEHFSCINFVQKLIYHLTFL